jgi:hypothetical protein
MDKDAKSKLRYLEKWNSNTNHVLVMIMCYINYLESQKDCDFFTDDVCFMKMRPRFVAVEMVYIGYITENFIEYKYWIADNDPTSKQMIIHHIMVVSGVWMGLYGGFAAAGVSNCACFCEVSAIFLNYRSMWSKKEMNDPLPTVNQLCFFFSYFIFRILLFPWCVWMLIISASWTFHLESVSLVRKICTTTSILMYIVVVFLNFYWFMLILKGLKKLLQEQGILKKVENEKEDDRLNFGLDDDKTAKVK